MPLELRQLPFPRHLRRFVRPLLSRSKKNHVFVGRLRCPCGTQSFQLLFPGQTRKVGKQHVPCTAESDGGYFFLVVAQCAKCDLKHLVIDQDLHGWNGAQQREEEQLPRPPLQPWKCAGCKSTKHGAVVEVSSQGKQDFIDEMPQLKASKWQDYFECLSLDITCKDCGRATETWFACETM